MTMIKKWHFSAMSLAAFVALGTFADLSWPVDIEGQADARRAAVLPSGEAVAFGEQGAFDTFGAVGYATPAYGDDDNAFDTVVRIVRTSAGVNVSTFPAGFCVNIR